MEAEAIEREALAAAIRSLTDRLVDLRKRSATTEMSSVRAELAALAREALTLSLTDRDSTVIRTDMATENLTGEEQRRLGIGKARGSDHPFPQALYKDKTTVAAWAEAIQISLFTLLIWIPAAIAAPHLRLNWTGLCISWIIGAAASVGCM